MNQRERLLAATVAGLVLMIIGYFLWSSASHATQTRTNRLTSIRQENDRQQQTLQAASLATQELTALGLRSLPKDREQANSVYSEWLLEQVDRVGFRNPSVRAADRRFRPEYFDRLRFDVEADATLDQLADFLAEFYLAGDLHKIRSLTLKPIPDSRHMDLVLVIEAIILPNSQRTAVGDLPSQEVDEEAVIVARESLRNRALLFPANIAPIIEDITNKEIVRGRRWRLEARASDPDPWDELEFAIKNEPPEGLAIDQRSSGSAVMTWTPRELGEYTIQLAVADSGNPQLESVKEFTLTVVEPEPRDASDTNRVIGFDHATQTFLVATVANDSGYRAWFDIRTQGKLLKLNVGDRVRVGSIRGDLTSITRRHAEITTDEGVLHVRIGQSLTDVTPQPAPDPADSKS